MDFTKDRPLRAFFFMLLAQLCFTSNILLLRLTERAESLATSTSFHLSPWEPMLLRSLVLSLYCLYLLKKNRAETLTAKENIWLWARGIAGVLSLSAYYYGVLHIPLGMASLFSNSSPLYVSLLAYFISKEILSKTRLTALIMGFIGVALVGLGASKSTEHAIQLHDLLIAMLSGPFAAAAYFSIHMLKRIRNEQIMLSLGLAGSIGAGIMLLILGTHFPQSLAGWLWLIASISPTIAAQHFLTLAFRLAPATQVTPLQYSGPLFSGLMAWIFLQETIPSLSIIGMAIVIFFGLILPYWEASHRT
ncbi:MAG: DMT family transporter [Proteobacteria bacterium]|nr:DMT family transporter [Pseudomonadota bacterium]